VFVSVLTSEPKMKLNRTTVPRLPVYPERVIQFGEGNFLRAFVDWMIQRMNEDAAFGAGVVVVQPIPEGRGDLLNAQDGLYHVILKGIQDGEAVREIKRVDCITRCINPYVNASGYEAYAALARNPDIRFVISNTTEAGIRWAEGETLEMRPQPSFPGKMAALLYARFEAFDGAGDKGLIVLCCELIEDNAGRLKELVVRHARNWQLREDFFAWLDEDCAFCTTLVDRIVPGFPRETIDEVQAELGFADQLVVVGEPYHSWVVQAPAWVEAEFPAAKIGLNVRFVDAATQREIRDRKVRVLNGCHSGIMPIAVLAGVETVRETIEHPLLGSLMNAMCRQEILPQLPGDPAQNQAFTDKILERFHNPNIRHAWRSISLNATSKWRTRVLPTLLDTVERTGALPPRTTLSLAALIAIFCPRAEGPIICQEDPERLERYRQLWNSYDDLADESDRIRRLRTLVSAILALEDHWHRDLNGVPGLTDRVTADLVKLLDHGILKTIEQLA